MSRYLSLDIETTGLNPLKDQVLEVGIILDDLQNPKPLNELPTFHCYIKHPRITGDPFALAMNNVILTRIATPNKYPNDLFLQPIEFVPHLIAWMEQNEYTISDGCVKDKVIIAGKNAATFDLPFLRAMTTDERSYALYESDAFYHCVRPAHRVIDPAMFYMKADDEAPPSLPECLRRAGLVSDISHRAIDDAVAVVKLIRHHFNIPYDSKVAVNC